MSEHHFKVWPAFESARDQLGSFKRLDILTGYLGPGASKVLVQLGIKNVRIIFGLDKTGPALSQAQINELKALQKMGADIRIYPGLHAKQYIFDTRALIVGSANFTKSGFEELQEVVLLTDDTHALRQAKHFFNGIWKKATKLPLKNIRPTRRSSTRNKNVEGGGGFGRKPLADASPFSSPSPASRKKQRPSPTPEAPKPSKTTRKKSSFLAPMQPSMALAAVLGTGKPLPRTDVVKRLWKYIVRHGLQDSQNKRMINADDKLKAVLDGEKQVSMFDMTKLVNKHLS